MRRVLFEQLLADYQLTTMTEAHLAAVADIEANAQITPWSHKLFADCLQSDYLCQVATYRDQCVAFQILSSVLDEHHLLNIAVAPHYQRRGIARAMLKTAIANAIKSGGKTLFLEVRASNTSAQALYHALQFEHFATRPAYYRTSTGHEDAFLMRCKL